MMKLFLSLTLIFISFLMYFLNHPLSMGLTILIQTLLTCMLTGLIMKTYWFSYILFLTFLGGLLVLFIYVSSIASNEIFFISIKMNLYLMKFILLILFFLIMFYYNLNWLNLSFNSDMDNLFNYYLFFNNENKINLSKLYNNQLFMLMSILIIYLFITLVAVVKITNIFYGPLRSLN